VSTSAAYTHGQIGDAELVNQSARFALAGLKIGGRTVASGKLKLTRATKS